jgi:hypothetical protein
MAISDNMLGLKTLTVRFHYSIATSYIISPESAAAEQICGHAEVRDTVAPGAYLSVTMASV